VDSETQTEQVPMPMDVSEPETALSLSSNLANSPYLNSPALRGCSIEALNGNMEMSDSDAPTEDLNSNLPHTDGNDEHLDTLDRKLNELKNATEDKGGIKRTFRKMENKKGMEDSMESSRDDMWSEEEGSVYSDHKAAFGRRSISRRPIAPCRTRRVVLRVPAGNASEDNEENTSEYEPGSVRSTLESNPELLQQMTALGSMELPVGTKFEVRIFHHKKMLNLYVFLKI